MGQSKKRRYCPAVTRDISSAECGENRQSRYACPESCPFNPYSVSNYDATLEIEDRVDALTMNAAASQIGGPDALAKHLASDPSPSPHATHAKFVRLFFFERDAAGKSRAERWLDGGLPELNNDERVLFRHKMQMRIGLIEIRRIIDDRQLEAVDLLEANPVLLRFVDRSLAATTTRFATILAWIYPSPHFHRLSGTAIGASDVAPLPALELLDACVAHLKGPLEPDAKRLWLAQHFERIDDVLRAVGMKRRQQALEATDGFWGAATYTLRASAKKCLAALKTYDDILSDQLQPEEKNDGFTTALVWLDAAKGPEVGQGRSILGRLLLGKKELRAQVLGGARLDRLRELLEKRLGSQIEFSRERRDNLTGKMLADEPEVDESLIPPRLLEFPTSFGISTSTLPAGPTGLTTEEHISGALKEYYRKLLDQKIPALHDHSPREAARDPALRGALLEWMKGLVRLTDARNLQTGGNDDVNGLIRELGLTEIDVPPPPPRAAPAHPEGEEDELDLGDFGHESAGRLTEWSAPPLPKRPLTFKEAEERLHQAMEAFSRAADALRELEQSGSTLLHDAHDLCASFLTDDEFDVFVVVLIQVWFAMVPRNQAPLLRFEAMSAELDRRFRLAEQMSRRGPLAVEKLLLDSPQPSLLQIAAANFMEAAKSGRSPVRLSPEATCGAMLVLSVIVSELDYALRR